METWLFKKLFSLIFIFLGDKIDFDAKISQEANYKEPIKNAINSYNDFNISPPPKILDLATGTGVISLYLSKVFTNSQIIGIDISTDMLARAREKAKKSAINNIEFLQGDVYDLPFPNNEFSLVTVSNALFSFNEVTRILKEDGILIVTLSKLSLSLDENKVNKKLSNYNLQTLDISSEKDSGFYLILQKRGVDNENL
ncbi:MAG: class I SAM-dependent methyltransferase [Bacillota bacterium]